MIPTDILFSDLQVSICQYNCHYNTSLSFHFQQIAFIFQTMETAVYHRRVYGKNASSWLAHRNQQYSKTGQYVSVTMSPKKTWRLPFFVHFPTVTTYFRRLPQYDPLRKNSEGLFNGMYYIPDTTSYVDNIPINPVIFYKTDCFELIRKHERYRLLEYATESVHTLFDLEGSNKLNLLPLESKKVVMKDLRIQLRRFGK